VGEVPNGKRAAREAAERALQSAALRLLRRDGVLAGLNMQEVADEASVNRGLIHRWFGSRQALLRAALRSRQEGLAGEVQRSLSESPPSQRTEWAVRQYVADPSYAQMVMLLALDGDDIFEPVPYLERRLHAFAAEIDGGVWPDDVDPLALTVLWDVILDGYFTMRPALARQTGIGAEELDRRVFASVGRLFGAVLNESDPAPGQPRNRRPSK
jgi:AcrR family transcriptional regulator